VYTNPSHTSGYIGDPFFFTNFTIQGGATPPVPPTPPTTIDIPDIAQIITPFTQPPSGGGPVTLSPFIDQNINQILDQQASVDDQLKQALVVGCYQVAN
jgi:hypothetical protein